MYTKLTSSHKKFSLTKIHYFYTRTLQAEKQENKCPSSAFFTSYINTQFSSSSSSGWGGGTGACVLLKSAASIISGWFVARTSSISTPPFSQVKRIGRPPEWNRMEREGELVPSQKVSADFTSRIANTRWTSCASGKSFYRKGSEFIFMRRERYFKITIN